MSECCLRGFKWDAKPKGEDTTLAGRGCYVTGNDSHAGIIIIHDIFGWTWVNTRLLADHYAEEVGATVYVPDFYNGEVLSADTILAGPAHWGELKIPEFFQRHSKEARTPDIFECARIIRSKHEKVGAIGFCFGGWGVFRLGAKANNGLVDCIATAHPTDLTKEEIDAVGVPVQINAPENDAMYSEEMKAYSNKVIPTLGVPYDYQFYPGLEHGFAVRGDIRKPKEREGLERAKNAVVLWFRQWLRDD